MLASARQVFKSYWAKAHKPIIKPEAPLLCLLRLLVYGTEPCDCFYWLRPKGGSRLCTPIGYVASQARFATRDNVPVSSHIFSVQETFCGQTEIQLPTSSATALWKRNTLFPRSSLEMKDIFTPDWGAPLVHFTSVSFFFFFFTNLCFYNCSCLRGLTPEVGDPPSAMADNKHPRVIFCNDSPKRVLVSVIKTTPIKPRKAEDMTPTSPGFSDFMVYPWKWGENAHNVTLSPGAASGASSPTGTQTAREADTAPSPDQIRVSWTNFENICYVALKADQSKSWLLLRAK